MSNLRQEKIDSITTQDIDFHQRRITNANDGIKARDYVTLRQLLGNASSGVGTSLVNSYTMNAASFNVPNITAIAGSILTIILTQDGTGSRLPVWNASYYVDAPIDLYYLANTKSVIGFVESGGKWQWDGRFVTGL
jgi:hypothetical protein